VHADDRVTRDPTHDILDAAAELAEQGGFDKVRLRDVAARAKVALATVYKRFPSKEALLAAEVARDSELLEHELREHPPRGETAAARIAAFFAIATRRMTDKPGYGRAVLRAMASGPDSARHVVSQQGAMLSMMFAAQRGLATLTPAEMAVHPLSEQEQMTAFLLLQIWFACMVGWSAGLHDVEAIDAQMRRAIEVVVRGATPR
jgi:TetR/AcrR family transcriptional regulator, cholesterol catabolism regulator